MSRYLVQYSPAAYEDLRAIYHHIAVELMVPETAENQTARIRSAVRALDTLPYRYAAVDWEPVELGRDAQSLRRPLCYLLLCG